jgi:HCOMODA/2-hydroxy-3-carboxy-muconic semialdehyde decarboxylase
VEFYGLRLRSAALLVVVGLVASGCGSEPPAAESTPSGGAPQAAAPHPEQELIEGLVLASRMLTRPELNVIGAQGHVSVRSQTNPNHYYISRYVSAGLVGTSDIIENDLDSKPVNGPRSDEFEEVYIHGEIYKARPDVMAVVHAHPPETIAFSVSSVRLMDGDTAVPVWDIRPVNKGQAGIVNTPELGRSLAQALGSNESILLLGHGVVVTSRSLSGVVSGSSGLVATAQRQQMLISMGGKADLNPRRVIAQPNQAPQPPPQPVPIVPVTNELSPGGTGGGQRGWDLLKRLVLKENGGSIPTTTPAGPSKAATPEAAVRQDLVFASRMLASQELGVLDFAGHVSVRSPSDPNRYLISRWSAPADATPEGIIENDLDSVATGGARKDEYREAFMHGEIYKTRPDVMAIVHAHTPEVVAFTQSSVQLRPVSNGGRFIGDGLPIFDIRQFHPRASIIDSPELGKALAGALGSSPGALLKGHGFTLTDSSVYGLVSRAYNLRMNALIQQQAINLGGRITYLDGQVSTTPPPPVVPTGNGGGRGADRTWEYWLRVLPLNE